MNNCSIWLLSYDGSAPRLQLIKEIDHATLCGVDLLIVKSSHYSFDFLVSFVLSNPPDPRSHFKKNNYKTRHLSHEIMEGVNDLLSEVFSRFNESLAWGQVKVNSELRE